MELKEKSLQSYGDEYEKRLEEVIEKVASDYLPQAILFKDDKENLELVLKIAILTGNSEIKSMIEKLNLEYLPQ